LKTKKGRSEDLPFLMEFCFCGIVKQLLEFEIQCYFGNYRFYVSELHYQAICFSLLEGYFTCLFEIIRYSYLNIKACFSRATISSFTF